MRLRSAPLPSVLEEIGRQSGVTIRARVLDTRTVTVAFEDVPFKQALRRLLGVQNFLLTYDGPRHPNAGGVRRPRSHASAP